MAILYHLIRRKDPGWLASLPSRAVFTARVRLSKEALFNAAVTNKVRRRKCSEVTASIQPNLEGGSLVVGSACVRSDVRFTRLVDSALYDKSLFNNYYRRELSYGRWSERAFTEHATPEIVDISDRLIRNKLVLIQIGPNASLIMIIVTETGQSSLFTLSATKNPL